jgi:hypothetical protein
MKGSGLYEQAQAGAPLDQTKQEKGREREARRGPFQKREGGGG